MIKSCYKVFAVPLFADNYSYIIQGIQKGKLVLVDPANPSVISALLLQSFPHYIVSHVLYTHKHWDHAGGSQQLTETLLKSNSDLKVLIGESDMPFVKGANFGLKKHEKIQINNSLLQTYLVPCHTRGHIVYHFQLKSQETFIENDANWNSLTTSEGKKVKLFESNSITFTGDTLFSGGIGRFFEGDAAEMVANISLLAKEIPQESHIFNGHQYTHSNLKWAKEVQSQNHQISHYFNQVDAQIQQKGAQDVCTLPTTFGRQKQINLFVRAVLGTPLHNTITSDPVKLMKILREMKNDNKTSYEAPQNPSM